MITPEQNRTDHTGIKQNLSHRNQSRLMTEKPNNIFGIVNIICAISNVIPHQYFNVDALGKIIAKLVKSSLCIACYLNGSVYSQIAYLRILKLFVDSLPVYRYGRLCYLVFNSKPFSLDLITSAQQLSSQGSRVSK